MKLIEGNIKEEGRRDLFWQKSFVENEQQKLLFKIIIAATEEFFSAHFKKPMAEIRINDEIKNWFAEKTKELFKKAKLLDPEEMELVLFDLYPANQAMMDFVQTSQ